jgi:hypothetical protein
MKRKLDTDDLVRALERFNGRYHAVDIFANDLSDRAKEEPTKSRLVARGGNVFLATVFPDAGVVRFEKFNPAVAGSDAKSGAVAGAVLGAAVAAANNAKGADVLGGALLGLLVGGLLGAAAEGAPQEAPRRVFAMQFDPETDRWEAYDGSLQVLRWMKSRLLAPDEPKVV